MKNRELIAELQKGDPEANVILQKDPEGNGYANLEEVDLDIIVQLYTEDVFSTNWSATDAGMSDAEWEKTKKLPRTIVLVPDK